jgi:MFS family permease
MNITHSSPIAPAGLARRGKRLRRSLVACSAEGLAAEVVSACFGPAVVAAWGIELGASPLLLAALWSVPQLSQLFMLPAAWVTTAFGRKRVAVAAQALARQITLPLAVLPLFDFTIEVKRTALLVLLSISSVLAVIGHNAWLAWIGDLVPARIRGTYFGRRTAMCTALGIVVSLLVASSLDRGRAHAFLGPALAAVVVMRSIAGAMTTVFMSRQDDSRCAELPPRIADLLLPLAHPSCRRLLVYSAAWGIATGLAASRAASLTVHALGLGLSGLAAYAVVIALLQVVTAPFWGRALDRYGATRVLVISSTITAACSLSWLGVCTGIPWLVGFDAVIAGLVVGGQELALFTLPLAIGPSATRPLFAAASLTARGVAFGLAAVAGGLLSNVVSLFTLLSLSIGWRVLAAVAAFRLGADPSRTVPTPLR